jgi:hypothetical protein
MIDKLKLKPKTESSKKCRPFQEKEIVHSPLEDDVSVEKRLIFSASSEAEGERPTHSHHSSIISAEV